MLGAFKSFVKKRARFVPLEIAWGGGVDKKEIW
jgi:hypothetical protein